MTAESRGGVGEATRLVAAMGLGPKELEALPTGSMPYPIARAGSAEALAYNALATSCPQIQSAMAQRGTTQSLLRAWIPSHNRSRTDVWLGKDGAE